MTVRLRSYLLTLPAFLVASAALATAASASTTISIKSSQVPVQASEFEEHGSCGYQGSAARPGQYGWHFVLPGQDPVFVSLTAHFATAGDVSLPGPDGAFVQDGKGAVVWTATDDTLTGAEAVIDGETTQGYFVLSDTCVPAPTPSATVSATETATPSETPSETVSATVSATASETASGTPSAEVSGERFTQTPSISPTVLGVKQTKGGVAGTGLPTTGSSLLGLVGLSGLLVLAGMVLTIRQPKGRYAR
jgi:hypothetical protein